MVIEVSHEPRRNVIIHEMSIYDTPEQLVRANTIGAPPNALIIFKWVNGVLFNFTALPLGGDHVISQEIIDGKLHWDHASFTLMPEYQERLIFDGIQAQVLVVNVTPNETFRAIGDFLQQELQRNRD